LFNKERGKYEDCLGVLQHAETNKVEIVTSALTIAEVLYIKGHPKITREKSEKICSFFEQSYIIIVNVDRFIAESARELIWDHSIKPKDAIHVASALKGKVPVFDTFDAGLLALDNKLGNPPLRIIKPNLPYQAEFQGEQFETQVVEETKKRRTQK